MSRAKGTYGTLSNWALYAAPRLPVAAGWVLIALETRSNYAQKTLSIAGLSEATGRESDQVRRGLALLIEYGAAVQTARNYAIGSGARMPELLSRLESRKGVGVSARTSARKYERKESLLNETNAEGGNLIPALLNETNAAGKSLISALLNEKKSLISALLNEKTEVPSEPSQTAKTTTPQGREGIEGREGIKTNNKAQESTAPVEASLSQGSLSESDTPATASETEVKILDKVSRRAPAAEMPELPASLATLPGMVEAWGDWLQYRKERRLTTAPSTAKGMFANLQKYHAEGLSPVEVVHNSIANGWQGLFPPRAPHVVKFQPKTTQEANDRATQRASDIYAMLQEETSAVF